MSVRGRDGRQALTIAWVHRAFGVGDVKQRALRMLEEASELYQASGGDLEQGHRLLDYVFSRPCGTVEQELGGLGITVLALAATEGVSADACEAMELKRVLEKPVEHFTARNAAKNAAGFKA